MSSALPGQQSLRAAPQSRGRAGTAAGEAEIDIAVSDGRITIQRRPPSYSLDELVEQITSDNWHDETDWGEPQGDEAW